MHPSLGEVALKNLLATWVVNDLTHIAQVTRVMAKQYKEKSGHGRSFSVSSVFDANGNSFRFSFSFP